MLMPDASYKDHTILLLHYESMIFLILLLFCFKPRADYLKSYSLNVKSAKNIIMKSRPSICIIFICLNWYFQLNL